MIDFEAKIKLEIKKQLPNLDISLEVPQDSKMGDYALPCFTMAKEFKKSPKEIAQDLAKKIIGEKPSKYIEKVVAVGPYVNFSVNRLILSKTVIEQIYDDMNYGAGTKKKEKVMVEYSQANTHKAFHVGHLRGTSIGESLSRILRFDGYEVVQANYQGDTGAHVAKWLWCYKKYHDGEKPPKENPEEWIARIYVEAVKKTDEKTQIEIDEVNFRLENNKDTDLKKLWKTSRKWSLDSLNSVYDELDAHFDKFFFEREMEKDAKKISDSLVKQGIAKVSDGAVVLDLEEYNLGIWVLLRKDGTCLYSAKDLALAQRKFEEYKIDMSTYVVGHAQSHHLKQLFKTLELMKFGQAKNCVHLAFSEVRLPGGKMSSRTGDNILYTQLRSEMLGKLDQEVKKRHVDWDEQRINQAIENIYSSAIKFDMLLQDISKPIVFDIDKALDFEGESGPYVQYVYARINSIFKKFGKQMIKLSGVDFDKLSSDAEAKLLNKLYVFPTTIDSAAKNYRPSILCRYLLDLSQAFNEFYHSCNILGEEEKTRNARLALCHCVKIVIKSGLSLLAIKSPEEM